MPPKLTKTETTQNTHFSDQYIYSVFLTWYNANKPNEFYLSQMVEEDTSVGIARKPSRGTLKEWITNKFKEWAIDLDEQLRTELSERTIEAKVKMMERHIEIGEKMQSMALDYLQNAENPLNSNSAVRLLIEGLRIERESRGIPDALKRLAEISDEKLLDEIQQLMANAPIEIEPLYDETET